MAYPQQSPKMVSTGGSASAITATVSNVTVLKNLINVVLNLFASTTNTGAVTLSVNGFPAAEIFKPTPAGRSSLTGSEITNGTFFQVFFDGSVFNLVSPVLSPGNTPYIPPGGGLVTYGTPGSFTFTVPSGVTTIKVGTQGGGGGGVMPLGYTSPGSNTTGGAGGGSGGYAEAVFNGLTPGATYSGFVGAGGAADTSSGSNARNGQDSYFTCGYEIRGHGGGAALYYTPGTGGIATGGGMNLQGNPGGQAGPVNASTSGPGVGLGGPSPRTGIIGAGGACNYSRIGTTPPPYSLPGNDGAVIISW